MSSAAEDTVAWPAGDLDPDRGSIIVTAVGRKGSGKTTFNRRLYQSWPHDRLCIDVNGEADPSPTATRVTAPLPTRMPERTRPEVPQDLHYVADPGSPTYLDDLDRAVGMALWPQDRPVLVWCGEVGEFTRAQRTGPHLRRLLMQSRHYRTSALFDGPRPVDIDRLVIAQADLVAVYELPDPDDRDRVAKVIGYPPRRFTEACEDTFRRGPYWYLLWVAADKTLYRCPPLPVDD